MFLARVLKKDAAFVLETLLYLSFADAMPVLQLVQNVFADDQVFHASNYASITVKRVYTFATLRKCYTYIHKKSKWVMLGLNSFEPVVANLPS